MAWRIELSGKASKDLDGIDHQVSRRILKFLNTRLASLDDPRSIGEALKGSKLGDFWKYRVGDYRILCDIQDTRILILVLTIGNRREVYR